MKNEGIAIPRTLLRNNVLKERQWGGETKVVEELDSAGAGLSKVIEKMWGIKFTEVEKKGVRKWGVGIVGPTDEKSILIAAWPWRGCETFCR